MEIKIAFAYFVVAFSLHLLFLRISYMYYKNRCRAVSVKAKGKRCFWSNCIVEAAKAKLSDYRNVRIQIFLPFDSKDRFFHVAWYVKRDGTTHCYDFQPEFAELYWYEFPLYKGYIRKRRLRENEKTSNVK